MDLSKLDVEYNVNGVVTTGPLANRLSQAARPARRRSDR